MNNYLAKHVWYTSVVHALAGIGVGIMIARPLDGGHPMRLGLILLGIAGLGHIYPMMMKK